MTERAVFLDRDGVINPYVYNAEFGTVDSPATPEEFALSDGARAALEAMKAAGYKLVVVSNQPGIAKGRFSAALLEAVTGKMLAACGGTIDAVYYCLHHPRATVEAYRQECACRKPKPGMLLRAAAEMEIDLGASFLVGDGLTDIAAGQAAGTRTVLVSARKCYLCDAMAEQRVEPDFVAASLSEAARLICTAATVTKKKGTVSDELHRELRQRSA